MRGPTELFAECHARGIRLIPAGDGGLTIDAPQDALTPDLIERLKAHKVELLAILKGVGPESAPWNVHDYAQTLTAAEAHEPDCDPTDDLEPPRLGLDGWPLDTIEPPRTARRLLEHAARLRIVLDN